METGNQLIIEQIEQRMLKGDMTSYLMQQQKGYVKFFVRNGEVRKEYYPISFRMNIAMESDDEFLDVGMKFSTLKNLCNQVIAMLSNPISPIIDYGVVTIPYSVDSNGHINVDVEFEKENHFRSEEN